MGDSGDEGGWMVSRGLEEEYVGSFTEAGCGGWKGAGGGVMLVAGFWLRGWGGLAAFGWEIPGLGW